MLHGLGIGNIIRHVLVRFYQAPGRLGGLAVPSNAAVNRVDPESKCKSHGGDDFFIQKINK